MRLLLFISIVLFLPLGVFAAGEFKQDFSVYLNYNLRPQSGDDIVIHIPHYRDRSNFSFNQKVQNVRYKFNSQPISKKLIQLEEGLSYYRCVFRPQQLKGKYSTVSYEVRFDVAFSVKLASIADAKKEYKPYEKTVSSALKTIFYESLKASAFANSQQELIQDLWQFVQTFAYEEDKDVEKTSPSLYEAKALYEQAATIVANSEKLNEYQRLSLYAELLRMHGIETRYVKALQLNQSLSVDLLSGDKLEMPGGKQSIYFLEVQLNDKTWVPVVPGWSIGVTPGLVFIEQVSLNLKKLIPVDLREKTLLMDYYFNPVSSEINNLSMPYPLKQKQCSWILSPCPSGQDRLASVLYPIGAIESQKMEFSAYGSELSQRAYIEDGSRQLRLKLGNLASLGGHLQLEARGEKKSYISRPIKENKVRPGKGSQWVTFSFAEELPEGWYDIVPKLKGPSVLYWSFLYANHNTITLDSQVVDKNQKKWLSGDFEIILSTIE